MFCVMCAIDIFFNEIMKSKKICVKKVSRKCFTIYVSVYNTPPTFRAQMGGGKSVDYT